MSIANNRFRTRKSGMSATSSNVYLSEIPKNIHFILVGSPIPQYYMEHVVHYVALARKQGFEITLWTDKSSNCEALNSLEHKNISLQIKTLEQLKVTGLLGSNPLPKEIHQKVWSYIAKEMIGLKNYAAAADIIRLEILRQEGGYYFDVDLKPAFHELKEIDPFSEFDEEPADISKEKIFSAFEIPSAPYGFLCYCEEWGLDDDSSDVTPEEVSRLGNHTLAATKNHKVIDFCLQNIIEEYTKLDTPSGIVGKNKQEFLLMDYKRSKNLKEFGGRRDLTIASSGPGILKEALKKYAMQHRITHFKELAFPLVLLEDDKIGIKMINAKVAYDNTWLKADKIKPSSFDY